MTGLWQEALDSPMNGVYGLSVAIWATLFVISWKRKQKMIQHIWCCQNNAFSKIDERKDEFKYYNTFNDRTGQQEIMKIETTQMRKNMLKFGSFFALATVFASMIFYYICNIRQSFSTPKGRETLRETLLSHQQAKTMWRVKSTLWFTVWLWSYLVRFTKDLPTSRQMRKIIDTNKIMRTL